MDNLQRAIALYQEESEEIKQKAVKEEVNRQEEV